MTADERRRLWRLVGSPDRAAVDMESCEAARVLDAAGLPFAVLRAVSDTSEDDLPMALKAARDSRGRRLDPAARPGRAATAAGRGAAGGGSIPGRSFRQGPSPTPPRRLP